jgi:glycosyltransferase involved in cell wall biosynthesis
VHFVGARPDSATFFQACDAFILPSRAEIWGATVVEAMACGVPPVVSPEVGSATVVKDGVNGYVLPSSFDARAIAATLDRAIGDPDRLTLMAGRCRATALRNSWEAHGRLVEQDLEETVARRKQRLERS